MRAIIRTAVVSGLVILAGFVVFRYSAGPAPWPYPKAELPAVGTSGTVNAEKVREPVGQAVIRPAMGVTNAEQARTQTAITGTIKAKIAVDDFVKARVIGVSTRNSVVTLTGRVQSPAEHDRAVTLARETPGVTDVVDHIVIEPAE